MEISIAEYTNARRFEMALKLLVVDKRATVVPVSGSFVMASPEFKCTASKAAVLAYPVDSVTPILVRLSTEKSDISSVVMDDMICNKDSMFSQLVSLCSHKFKTSKNPFTLECASTKCTLLITPSDGTLNYTMRTPSGEAFMSEEHPIKELLDGCSKLNSFSFKVITDTCEKDICVKRGKVDILREISHYLGKTLVLTTMANGRPDKTVCIGNFGCCELKQSKGRKTAFYPYQFNKVTVSPDMCVSCIELPVNKLVGKPSFAEAIKGGAS